MRQFWANAEKVVEYRTATLVEARKRKAMDAHLNFIVGQTERLSSLVSDGFHHPGTPSTSRTPSIASMETGGDYVSASDSETDDERTIARAEKKEDKENVVKELTALEKESQVTLTHVIALTPRTLQHHK